MRLLVTGANGHIGRRLIRRLNENRPGAGIVALVRSERAAEQIRADKLNVTIYIVDYSDENAIREVGQREGRFDAIVHLVGIIRESGQSTFAAAHEGACQALVSSGISSGQIICLGIVGSSLASANACLLSRAKAEQILLSSDTPVTILRVPMVLGPDDYASISLGRNGRKRIAFTFRSSSLEQPIFSEDVIAAIAAALELEPENRVLQLAGPEPISRKALIGRAGQVVGGSPVVVSLPLSLGYLVAFVLEKLSANPPVSRAMLGVLDHDDAIDVTEATQLLSIELTSLDETLDRVLI